MGIALTVVAAAAVVLLAVGSAPAVVASHDRPRVPFAVAVGRTEQHGLTAAHYAAWVDANDRFTGAARSFQSALGGCRMRLGSFHACATASVGAMAYESHNAAGVAAVLERQPGPCGRTMRAYGQRLVEYMASAQAVADVPHGHPNSAVDRLQSELLRQQEAFSVAALRVRALCRPG
jgi:hypothetical protein